jgi:NADH-quinone oxidoreductase subunit I
MTFLGKNVSVAIVKGLIITIQHLFTRKVTIQYRSKCEMSPCIAVSICWTRDEQGRRIVRLVVLCVSCPAEAITMKAEEKQMKTFVQRGKICVDIWNQYVALYFFCGVWRGLSEGRYLLTTSKVLVPSSYEREDFIFGRNKSCPA